MISGLWEKKSRFSHKSSTGIRSCRVPRGEEVAERKGGRKGIRHRLLQGTSVGESGCLSSEWEGEEKRDTNKSRSRERSWERKPFTSS